MGDLTEHFDNTEFACKGKQCCGGLQLVYPILIDYAEELRSRLDLPLTIRSGFRCITHNRAVLGSPDSKHCQGRAIDIEVPEGMTMAQFVYHTYITKFCNRPRLILYPQRFFVHFDLDPYDRSFGYIDLKPVPLEFVTHHESFFVPYRKVYEK